MKNRNFVVIFLLTITVTTLIQSCKKLLEIDTPITTPNQEIVYGTEAQAIAVVTGIYTKMSGESIKSPNISSITLFSGFSSDELTPANASDLTYNAYANNSLLASTGTAWSNYYNTIYITNAAIEGISASIKLKSGIKNQLLGEAKFIRALNYLFLVNLFGDVPLAVTTDYQLNAALPRTSKDIIYKQIIEDLLNAQGLLSENYLEGNLTTVTSERVRPNRAAATALLARAYLYHEEYNKAENEASKLIENRDKYNLVPLDSVFLKNNTEAIWQLMPVGLPTDFNANSKEGPFFLPSVSGLEVYLTDNLVGSFEKGDQRRNLWVGEFEKHYYPQKYKVGKIDASSKEYSTLIRLGEIYLIRAEARIRQNNISGGVADLNILRKRATNIAASIQDQLIQLNPTLSESEALLAVEHERRIELFTEYGHRWLDLKRTNRVDEVMSAAKGTKWQHHDSLYPIPLFDINANPKLKGYQNPGY